MIRKAHRSDSGLESGSGLLTLRLIFAPDSGSDSNSDSGRKAQLEKQVPWGNLWIKKNFGLKNVLLKNILHDL